MTFQEKIKPFGPPPIREKEPNEKDENHSAEYMSDFRYNDMDWHWCYTLNGEFIGRDNIGIDQYAYEIDQTTRRKEGLRLPFVVTGIGPQNETLTDNYTNKELEEKGLSYIINGHHIYGFTNYKSDHPVNLMTLDEIRRKRCPQVKDEKVLYMINKFFILWEWEWYKVDEDFIWRVEVLPSYMLTPTHPGQYLRAIHHHTHLHQDAPQLASALLAIGPSIQQPIPAQASGVRLPPTRRYPKRHNGPGLLYLWVKSRCLMCEHHLAHEREGIM